MHADAYFYVADTVRQHGPFADVVEFGSRDINGSIRGLFLGARYLGIDIVAGAGVDIVGDASQYRTSRPHDCVVCCEVLEHVPNPDDFIEAAWAALRPGGRLIFTMASPGRPPHSAVDGGPVRVNEHYANIDPAELKEWLINFDDVAIEEHPARGDLYVTARKG